MAHPTAPRRRRGRRQSGFTILELVIVVAIIGILASLIVPRMLRLRTTANEAAAMASIRSVGTAEEVYARTCANGGFAVSFPVLGKSPPNSTAPFLSPDLTGSVTPVTEGYRFSLTPGASATAGPDDCNGTETQTTFYTSAEPARLFGSGTRAFALNNGETIWERHGSTAPAEPFGPPSTPVH